MERTGLRRLCGLAAALATAAGCDGGGSGRPPGDGGQPGLSLVYALGSGYTGAGDYDQYITAHSVDQDTGGLTEIDGSPFIVPSLVDGGARFAAAPSGEFIYLLRSGTAPSLTPLRVEPTGALTPLEGIAVPTHPSTAPLAMAIDPAGRFIYVVSAGFYVDTFLDVYAIGADGSLTATDLGIQLTAISYYDVAATVAPSGRFLHVLNSGQLDVYPIEPTTGAPSATTQRVTLSIGSTSGKSMVMDPAGQHVYVGYEYYHYDPGTQVQTCEGNIQAFTVAESGTLTALGAPTPLPGYCIETMAIDPGGRQVYVGTQVDDATFSCPVLAFPVAEGGELTGPGAGLDTYLPQFDLAFDASGRFLYAATNPEVSGFTANPAGGALTSELPGSPYALSSAIASGFGILTLVARP